MSCEEVVRIYVGFGEADIKRLWYPLSQYPYCSDVDGSPIPLHSSLFHATAVSFQLRWDTTHRRDVLSHHKHINKTIDYSPCGLLQSSILLFRKVVVSLSRHAALISVYL